MSYTKLFQSIITSTIWGEDDQTKIVWITLLALADKNGEVQGSLPGVARMACVSTEAVEKALSKFLSPDPYSRTTEDEGRRIEVIDGGWHILNHKKYRDMASDEDRKEKAAIRQQRFRDRKKRNAIVTPALPQNPQAEANTNTDSLIGETIVSPQAATAPVWEELWKESPINARKRSSKAQCKGAWGRIPKSKRPSLETILSALKAWKKDDAWRKNNGEFIPGLHRWINQRQWEDLGSLKDTSVSGIKANRKKSAAEMGI